MGSDYGEREKGRERACGRKRGKEKRGGGDLNEPGHACACALAHTHTHTHIHTHKHMHRSPYLIKDPREVEKLLEN